MKQFRFEIKINFIVFQDQLAFMKQLLFDFQKLELQSEVLNFKSQSIKTNFIKILIQTMIKAIACSLAKSVKLSQQSIFAFSSVKDSLKKKLDEEIKYESDNKPSVNEYINFFNNNGWDVNYSGTQVELVRKNGQYNLRVLFNARNPSSDDAPQEENQQQPPEEQNDFNDDYSQVSVYINKNGQSKWLCAEFFVTEQTSEIAGVRFIGNYENERTDRFKERNSSSAYPGPQIHSLEETLSDKIGEFIESVGVDHSLLQNASNFSVAYEHQFYLEWLKDLKSVL